MVCFSYRFSYRWYVSHWEVRNLQAWTLNLKHKHNVSESNQWYNYVPYSSVYPHNYFWPPPPTLIDYYTVFIPKFTLQIYFFICDNGMSVHVS